MQIFLPPQFSNMTARSFIFMISYLFLAYVLSIVKPKYVFKTFYSTILNTTFLPANFLLVWSIMRNSLKLYFYTRTPPLLKYSLVNKHKIATVTIKHSD